MPYRHIAVAINLTDQDATTLEYASAIIRYADADQVTVLHVLSSRGLPIGLLTGDEELTAQALTAARESVESRVKRHLSVESTVRVRTEVARGRPVYELLHFAREQEPDLFIAGRNPDREQSGMLPERLARKAPCSILLVPRGSAPRIGRILVPVDFSANAAAALQTAATLGERVGAEELRCLHAYGLPPGYSKLGRSAEEFGRSLKKHAKREFDEFVQSVDTRGLSVRCEYVMERYASRAIYNAVENGDVDLLVLGSRGRSTGASLLLGSTTERVLNAARVPVLAVKDKGSNLTILEALLELTGS